MEAVLNWHRRIGLAIEEKFHWENDHNMWINLQHAQRSIDINGKYEIFYPLSTDAYINIWVDGEIIHTERYRYVGGVDFVKDITINTTKPVPSPEPTSLD